MMQQTSNGTSKNWSVKTIGIATSESYTFGINTENIGRLTQLLMDEKFYMPEPGVDFNKFTFRHLQATIYYLKKEGFFEPNLHQAVENLMRKIDDKKRTEHEVQEKKLESKPKLIRDLQIVLYSFMSPDPPVNIRVDGKWGPQTADAFNYILDVYNLPEQEPNEGSLARLKTISGRVIRFVCSSSEIIDTIEYNPFGIIHTDARDYEIDAKGSLIRLTDNKRLLEFPGLPEQDAAAALSFNTFCAWFMILNMRSSYKTSGFNNLNILIKDGKWGRLADHTNQEQQSSYMIKPDYCITLPDTLTSFSLSGEQPAETELIGVFLSGSMRIAVTRGLARESADGPALVFETGDFFGNELEGNRKQINHFEKADYLKIFEVKKGFADGLGEKFTSFPGVDTGRDFYGLITAMQEDILDTALIGLSFENSIPPTPKDFRSTVEKLYNERKIQVPDDLQKNRWGGKNINNGKRLKAGVRKEKSSSHFNVVLVIEGVDPSTRPEGDTAFFIHNTFRDEIKFEPAVKGKVQLELIAYEAFTVGALLEDGTELELDLNEVPGFPKEFYYPSSSSSSIDLSGVSETFKKETQAIYKKQPVRQKEDLQKGRWGGRSINGGKIITAEVTEASMKDYYSVTIHVRSESSGRSLTDGVAFFLHDSFGDVIRYRNAIEGEARLALVAYEDFTIGAYTEDGTMLELDLSSVKGYPEGFYAVNRKK
ncbi:MAG TPA: pYEATS domain-containing protein [Chitinophagaceae bacterium]|jgi:hypothetical protein|nr:pYEATS domain-containing protein [Chitinophagaceae bacterium]